MYVKHHFLSLRTYGKIAPRSRLDYENFIDVGAGVVDRGYTGNVCVPLYTHSSIDLKVLTSDSTLLGPAQPTPLTSQNTKKAPPKPKAKPTTSQ